ncbi:hypothetical protein OMAG_001430 [Candidatus Omnitrophus magneticus]|uniref:Uncharacterized protein n=1 Tax=Candidatus Omnitrophus magneticus TaxID=1609969 RepID=A0A0F0CN02_9BACT|nr:hypothetical protein OMAG_001430 [Candidatus Omnitrophus magneticus]KJR41755.1 hypothetical protein MCHI_002356 [Candidatus Magnetoovum chiemensis]
MSTDISSYLVKVEHIFSEIDKEYEYAQKHYGDFSCEGCQDNCCTTVFYHHTLAEYFYLAEGLDQVDDKIMNVMVMRSEMYFNEVIKNPFNVESLRIMCPLNLNDKCCVYKNRPLICRIHGVPSILHTPRRETQKWNGCKRFEAQHKEPYDHSIDRTKLFTQLATLEGQLRKDLVFPQRYKKTIAEMVLDYIKGEITAVNRNTSAKEIIRNNFGSY